MFFGLADAGVGDFRRGEPLGVLDGDGRRPFLCDFSFFDVEDFEAVFLG